MRPREPSANNALDDQVVSGGRRPNPDSEIELPLRAEVDVNRGKELLLLLMQRVESSQWAVRGVVLEPSSDLFRKVVTDSPAKS